MPPIYSCTENARISQKHLVRFGRLVLQFSLLILLVYVAKVEEQLGLQMLLVITLPSFVIQALLPLGLRAGFLILVFLATCLWFFGLVSGGFIIMISLLLFLVAIMQIHVLLKVFGLGIIIGLLILLRSQLFFAPRAILATPYIASMFMFRLISYFQHQRLKKVPAPFFQRLNYFLLLPNLTFLIFPIIDYHNFVHSYYNEPALKIYQKGLNRIFTGVFLLLLYRAAYTYFSINEEDVESLRAFLAYISVNYVLIIRVAGMLLIGLGLVTLTGYNLPPLFENFFLAKGFSDLWRRINIYWRDFIIKTFYFPVYFKLRRRGQYAAMLTAGLLAFVCSWLLHSYQLFWLSGTFKLRTVDFIYWITMGLFITADGMLQYSKLVRRKQAKSQTILATLLISGTRIIIIFIFAATLWSLWNAESLPSWLFMIRKITLHKSDFLLLGYLLPLIILIGTFSLLLNHKEFDLKLRSNERTSVIFTGLTLAAIIFLFVASKLSASSDWSVVAEKIARQHINDSDREAVDEGYYGQILESGGILSSKARGIALLGDMRWGSADGAMRRTGDIYLREFKPGTRVKHYNFHMYINRLGLRDKEYSINKPTNTSRWIFLGGSYVTGFGVEMENTFEALTEKGMNDSLMRTTGNKLQIINYSCFGYGLPQQAELCKDKIFRVNPDAVFYFAHPDEPRYCTQMLSKLAVLGIDLSKQPFLAGILKKANVRQTQSRVEMNSRIRPFGEHIVEWGYQTIVSNCRSRGVKPVWVFLPTTADGDTRQRYEKLRKIASLAGFICLDLSGVFENQKLSLIQGGGVDTHPSIYGHTLIAKKLEFEIRKNHDLLFQIKR